MYPQLFQTLSLPSSLSRSLCFTIGAMAHPSRVSVGDDPQLRAILLGYTFSSAFRTLELPELGDGGVGYIRSSSKGTHEGRRNSVAPIPAYKLAELSQATDDDFELLTQLNALSPSGVSKPDSSFDDFKDVEDKDSGDDFVDFEKKVEATCVGAVCEKVEVNHAIIELNSLRLSYQMTNAECALAIFYSMMRLASETSHSSASGLRRNVGSAITTWRKLLKYYLQDIEERLPNSYSGEQFTFDTGKQMTTLQSRYHADFEELQLLGEGGFGEVFQCRNILDGQIYALKRIPFMDDDVETEKIFREVQVFSSLHHRHIVRYYQAWVEDRTLDSSNATKSRESVNDEECSEQSEDFSSDLYIQMEYCSGSLFERLQEGVDYGTGWRYFSQLVDGVCHVHKMGLIHRDLSRKNIFLDSKMNIKLGDFGLAKFLKAGVDGSLTASGSGDVGVPLYQAPEVRGAHPQISEKVDIFSLGILLFELLYPLRTDMERNLVLGDLREGKFPRGWKFPEHEPFILELLSSRPSDRPSAAQIQRRILPWTAYDVATNMVQSLEEYENSCKRQLEESEQTIFRLMTKLNGLESTTYMEEHGV